MEDIRKLIEDHEAEIAPESLGYLLRGLAAATHEFVREGTPSDPKERQRHREMVYACSLLAEQYATMLSRWLGAHMDDCERR